MARRDIEHSVMTLRHGSKTRSSSQIQKRDNYCPLNVKGTSPHVYTTPGAIFVKLASSTFDGLLANYIVRVRKGIRGGTRNMRALERLNSHNHIAYIPKGQKSKYHERSIANYYYCYS